MSAGAIGEANGKVENDTDPREPPLNGTDRLGGASALLFAAWLGAGAANAQPGAAEAAIADQQALVRSVVRTDCRRPAEGDEITVCGRRDEDARHRLPLPVVGPPNPADRAGGEQLAAMNAGDDRCTPVGRDQQCNGGLDVIGIGFTIARAIAKAVEGND